MAVMSATSCDGVTAHASMISNVSIEKALAFKNYTCSLSIFFDTALIKSLQL